MKFLRFFVVATLICAAIFSFSSCKKNSDNTSHPLEGKWVGTYGFGNETPHVYYAFKIQSNGTLEELNQAGNSKGSGTWKLNGNTFTATYQWKAPMNSIYTVVATYDAATQKLTGTWGYENDGTNGGAWEQSRQ
jgi:hypothetical protein